MGFNEAIEQSGWDPGRKEQASQLCDDLRETLRRPGDPAYEHRIYDNLDSDELIEDIGESGKPATRPQFLGELLDSGPPPVGEPLKTAAIAFCREHKQEGPEDSAARERTLGRVWDVPKLALQFKFGKSISLAESTAQVNDIVAHCDLDQQRELLADVLLAPKLMWSFYDATNEQQPFAGLSEGRAALVDRLGLGEYEQAGVELIRWSHTLPSVVEPHTPTAWDGGARRPYWFPGGRTRPLSADGRGTGQYGPEEGQPEVVHDPVTGAQLAAKIDFVADEAP